MTELIDTTEMYLKTVYELEEDGVPPLRARIVERLDHSGPTVSQTVARMERDGLIKVAEDRSLELTDEGRRRATDVIRKHRLAERLLLDVIGIVVQQFTKVRHADAVTPGNHRNQRARAGVLHLFLLAGVPHAGYRLYLYRAFDF